MLCNMKAMKVLFQENRSSVDPAVKDPAML